MSKLSKIGIGLDIRSAHKVLSFRLFARVLCLPLSQGLRIED